LRLEEFDYDLPQELIAQEPAEKRTASRLLVLDRKRGEISHRVFSDLPRYLVPGDLLVLNDTRVIPARLLGRKEGSGGSVEALLVRPLPDGCWEALVKPGKRVKPGHTLIFGEGRLRGEVVDRTGEGMRVIRFVTDSFWEDLAAAGQVPLPPYIRKPVEDPERYQTVFARHRGSSAAPTAALHFDVEMLAALEAMGVERTAVTLHIGPGTFRPVKTPRIEDHQMHEEYFSMGQDALNSVMRARREGRRVIPVGTTSTRVLETVFAEGEQPSAREGWTGIFIYPGCQFQAADAMLTNFHLPRSTLLMMISAFAGIDLVREAYRQAVRERYRFFSFGDCMLIL
jgi:S-adenosylmethionine:tRNA ribosyltransferase-isomerase